MHFVHWTLLVKTTLALPYLLLYVDFREGEVPPHFTIHMLQNKELLSLKQWHLIIGYIDRTMSFITFKQYIVLPYT